MRFTKVLMVALAVAVYGSVNAQGFLKKAKAAADKATQTVAAATGASDSAEPEKKIAWDKIPVYTAKQFVVSDEAGNPVLNEDGTPQVRVFLVDQFGNKRSAEAVKAQNDKLKKSIGAIIAKVGGGAALGAVGGLLGGGKGKGAAVGAAAGAAAGALASIDDIKQARAQHNSLKEQEKLIKAYSKTFTAEGTPVDAKADLSKVKDLNLDLSVKDTITASQLKDELDPTKFNTTDDDWEV